MVVLKTLTLVKPPLSTSLVIMVVLETLTLVNPPIEYILSDNGCTQNPNSDPIKVHFNESGSQHFNLVYLILIIFATTTLTLVKPPP